MVLKHTDSINTTFLYCSPLKQFTDAVLSREAMERMNDLVEQRGHGLQLFSCRLSKMAFIVALANPRSKHRSENLLKLSSQVKNLTPQLTNAGTIKMKHPKNKAVDENFENLRKQCGARVQTIRDCDEAIDIRTFLKQTSKHISRYCLFIQNIRKVSVHVSDSYRDLRGRSAQ